MRMAYTEVPGYISSRVSYEPHEEEVQQLRQRLEKSQWQLQQLSMKDDSAGQQLAKQTNEYIEFQEKHPNVLDNIESYFSHCQGRRLAVFLDYDGTLSPIVSNPDRAYMCPQMRQAVKELSMMFPVAIISGRGREKVEQFVKIQDLYYAGSHGLDIQGPPQPNGMRLVHRPAQDYEDTINTIYHQLMDQTPQVPGSSVEHNKFCVSVHFRNVQQSLWKDLFNIVQKVLEGHPNLKLTRGRKVLEVRPQITWDKGQALLHLLRALGLADAADVFPIYIGDDKTDEDAFAALNAARKGAGIVVSNKAKPSVAKYSLTDPNQVLKFLNRLVAWGRKQGNGWLENPQCIGWSPSFLPTIDQEVGGEAEEVNGAVEGGAGGKPQARHAAC